MGQQMLNSQLEYSNIGLRFIVCSCKLRHTVWVLCVLFFVFLDIGVKVGILRIWIQVRMFKTTEL